MAHYTYKFRLQPNADQRTKLAKHFGVCRFVYNYFLDRRMRLYQVNGKGSSYYKDNATLTTLKRELDWMYEANSQSLQAELKNLDTAYTGFFKKKARFPRFRAKHHDKQSFRVPQHVEVIEGRVYIPKFKEGIKLIQHRPMDGTIRNATVSMNRAGQYFVCICVERGMKKLKPDNTVVGVDLGIKTLVTLSDGSVFGNIRPYLILQRRLRHLQKSLRRKVKGSHNYVRARNLLARCHQKIADIRSNHLHKVSSSIVRENQTIVLEDLNVAGMCKNRRLAKVIADAGFGELVRQIEYKAGWYGRTVVKLSRWYPSSKTCHNCGYVNEGLTLSDRAWTCPRCQVVHDRDLNAAINIRDEGIRQRKQPQEMRG